MPDLRHYSRQTQNRLVIGLFILVCTIGLLLIYWLYGLQSALIGLVCLAGLLLPISLILLILTLIERFLNNERQ